MSLCVAGAGKLVQVLVTTFTLSWTHTAQKTKWQEDWRVEAGRLVLGEARVQGSGAGMEPPEGSVLRDGFYAWRPDVPPLPELTMRRAPQAGDWRLCAGGRCDPLSAWLGADADPVVLSACRG